MEMRNVFALIENAAGDAILNLRSERPRLLQVAWVVTIGVCIEVPIQQIFVRREVIVCRTRLEHLDEGKTAVLNGGLENTSHQFDVAAKATGNEGGVEREDQVHARQRLLGDPVGARVHRLALWRERTRLPGRQPVVCIVGKDERDRIIAPHAVDQMPDTLRESRAIPAEGDDRDLHISELRACCKRDDATMEPVEAVALDFVRAVAVTTDIVAKANLPRMQIQLYQSILHGRPNAIVAAAVTPDAFGFRIVLGKSGPADLLSDIHDAEPAYSKRGKFSSFS